MPLKYRMAVYARQGANRNAVVAAEGEREVAILRRLERGVVQALIRDTDCVQGGAQSGGRSSLASRHRHHNTYLRRNAAAQPCREGRSAMDLRCRHRLCVEDA